MPEAKSNTNTWINGSIVDLMMRAVGPVLPKKLARVLALEIKVGLGLGDLSAQSGVLEAVFPSLPTSLSPTSCSAFGL